MDSICSPHFSMISELIDGEICMSLSSSFWNCGAQVKRGVAGTMLCSVQQLHHPHLHYSSFSGNSRGHKRNQFFRACTSKNVSGEAESTERLWEKYFADPSVWYDNRINKRIRTTPDFKHKVTGEALWILSPSTPPWVKAMLKELEGAQRRKERVERIPELQDSSELNRQPKHNNGNAYRRPPSTRAWRRTGSVCDAGQQVPQASTSKEAVAHLKNRLQQGITIDDNMCVDVLQRCLKERDLPSAKQVHDCILKSGMEQNQYVANNLLRVYIRCGRLQDAHQVFEKLMEKNVVNWTTMIGGYAESGSAKDAMEYYYRMRQEGRHPNEITYLSVLKSCASPDALKWGKEIHAHIRESGLRSDVRVETALVNMYVKCGSIDDARIVFDKMVDRNVISWTVMLGGLAQHGRGQEAFDLFLQMQREGLVPDAMTYVSILNACASTGALEWVREVHRHAVQAGLASDLRVATALVHMYAKCGSIRDARFVFDGMVKRSIISWTVMIGGLAQHGFGREAYDLFLQMQSEGFVPDAKTYVSILNSSASTGALQWVRKVHNHAVKARLATSDLRVGNALVHMYAKSGSIEDARNVFEGMAHRDLISWNMMIGGLAQHGKGQEAFSLFLQMQKEGFIPDATTCASILSVSTTAGSSEWVKEVHKHAIKEELLSDLRLSNALVHIYAKSGSIDDARVVFNDMVHRDVISWTVMIGGLAQHGRGQEALQLFDEMKSQGVKPDGPSFVAVLSACSHAGLVDEGRFQFSSMTQDFGIEPSVEHYNCMVDILGRAGHLQEAKLFITTMPINPVESTWGALLGACRTHGNLELAEHAARELFELNPKDASTYVLLSNTYAAAGKWDQVSLVRRMMEEKGIRKEPGRSWVEIDNKIHRFVVGDKSHPEAKEIYAELERLIKLLKTEGYVPDTRLVLHSINEEDKELSLCSHSEKLAITYGLMHTPKGKPVRVFENLRVCQDCHTATKFISKVTRREIVARDANRFHHFKDGVCSCGDYW